VRRKTGVVAALNPAALHDTITGHATLGTSRAVLQRIAA
jgi:hypothetical protein